MVMRIKTLRKAARLTQTQLATKLGLSQNSLSQWETEVVLPRTRDLPQLAEVLGCTIDELFEDPNEEVKGKCWEKL